MFKPKFVWFPSGVYTSLKLKNYIKDNNKGSVIKDLSSDVKCFLWTKVFKIFEVSSHLKVIPNLLLHQLKRNLTLVAICTQKMVDWTKEKARYLDMPIDQKRMQYKCGTNFKTLDSVDPWPKYFTHQEESLTRYGKTEVKLKKDSKLNNKVSLWAGDITQLEVDAIVNAANYTLLGGSGGINHYLYHKMHVTVDGAIHRAAGHLLKLECISLNGCHTGEAKITGGYRLPAKYVIHTVGPQGEQPDLLRNCYNNSLSVLTAENLRTVAFPCISTGLYGYPIEPAAHVALSTVRQFLNEHLNDIDRVIFCVFLPRDVKIYEDLMQEYFPV